MQPREPRPEPPLRISVAHDLPVPPGSIDPRLPTPEQVRWLLRSPSSVPLTATSVNLKERAGPSPEIGAGTAPTYPPADTPAAPHSRPANAPMPPAGPSLSDRLRAALLVPLATLLPGDASVLEWPATLLAYQLDGVRTLIERDRVLLADDMGLGKTVQALAAIRVLCVQRAIERVLLIVPASLVDQWRREIVRWAPELRVIIIRGPAADRAWKWTADAHITLISYETFRADFAVSPDSARRRRTWDLVILDEAQKMKNRATEVSRSVKQLRRRRSWAITGTPLENTLGDLASILEFVDHRDDGKPQHYGPGPVLVQRHAQLQLRRRKSDLLTQLPPKQVITVRLPLLPHQQAAYARAETEGVIQLQERGATVTIQHVLELITRLKQICNVDPVTRESAKLADIKERLGVLTAEGHRALLFSQYTSATFGVHAAAQALAEFAPLTFTGSMSGGARDATIQQFKAEHARRILILSLKAGGSGLNLQEASYVFHLDRWWNPAVERQAEDRAHRMGQVYPVTVFAYVCSGTIEERIERLLQGKQRLFDEIIDDVSILPTRLNQADLFGLFGMPAPAAASSEHAGRRSGRALEDRCAEILRLRGWSVARTPVTRDGGPDLIATKQDEIGIEQQVYVLCKAQAAGVEVVRELLGMLPTDRSVRAVLAAPAGITRDARALADRRHVAIWDEAVLTQLEAGASGNTRTSLAAEEGTSYEV